MKLRDIIGFPRVTHSYFRVWQRNLLYYRKNWATSFLWTCLEPLVFLCGIGYGLGFYVQQMEGTTYVEFLLPGILASTAMTTSFFEGTYGHFTKLTWQKTYSTILLTRVTPEDVVFGELLWTACKGFFGCLGVIVVAAVLGLIKTWTILPALLPLFATCWLFSCLGMIVTSYVRSYDSFVYYISGIIIPMSFISGIYYPLAQLPAFLRYLAWAMPLTHSVSATRLMMLHGQFMIPALQTFVILLLGFVAMNFAIYRIRNKLIS